MLSELIASFTTPLSPPLRALGYLDEFLDMRRRAHANRAAWQPHLDATRRFVLSAARTCRNRNTVVVLGSGLLLDVPLAELSALFGEVVLKDVVCLPEVRRQIRTYQNTSFSECDVTGVAKPLYALKQQAVSRLPEPLPPDRDSDAGLTVSLNILSQLWVVPRAYAARHLRGITEDRIDDWCRQIVGSHYQWLRSQPGDVCMVADHAFIKRDGEGKVISRASTVYDLELPPPDTSWTWHIVPPGKDPGSASKELLVGAWHWHGPPRSKQA
jgi:hypothetical protein